MIRLRIYTEETKVCIQCYVISQDLVRFRQQNAWFRLKQVNNFCLLHDFSHEQQKALKVKFQSKIII